MMHHHWSGEFRCNDDDAFTYSSTEQKRVEEDVLSAVADALSYSSGPNGKTERRQSKAALARAVHREYLMKGIVGPLPAAYSNLDASRTWLCYWILHACEVLRVMVSEELKKRFETFLKTCQNKTGGYGGGPGQLSHLAATYAAVMALSTLQSKEALASIDRDGLLKFFQSLKQKDGSFVMQVGGEVDVRAVYCMVSVAVLLNLPYRQAGLFDGTPEWLASCQTYEGGFGAEPGAEAHGFVLVMCCPISPTARRGCSAGPPSGSPPVRPTKEASALSPVLKLMGLF